MSRFHSFRRLARISASDLAAILAAIELPWSTGPVDGHMIRVKLIKQLGHGRVDLALVRARVLAVQSVLVERSDACVLAQSPSTGCGEPHVRVLSHEHRREPSDRVPPGISPSRRLRDAPQGELPDLRHRVPSARFRHDPEQQDRYRFPTAPTEAAVGVHATGRSHLRTSRVCWPRSMQTENT